MADSKKRKLEELDLEKEFYLLPRFQFDLFTFSVIYRSIHCLKYEHELYYKDYMDNLMKQNPHNPNIIGEYLTKELHDNIPCKITDNLHIIGFAGLGCYGFVLSMINPETKKIYAVKFCHFDNATHIKVCKKDFNYEVNQAQRAYECGAGLKIYGSALTNHIKTLKVYGIIVMQHAYQTVDEYLYKLNHQEVTDKQKRIIDRKFKKLKTDLKKLLKSSNIIHKDFHDGNIMMMECTEKTQLPERLYAIDFETLEY